MKDLKTIMIEYANAHGRGLPLTPEEMCNAVVIWVQQFVEQSGGGSQITVAQLFELIKGSETVVVDENEEGTALEVHLDEDVVNKLERALLTPVSPPQEETFVAISANGSQTNVPKSVLDQRYSGKLYKHSLEIELELSVNEIGIYPVLHFYCINNYEQPFVTEEGDITDFEWWKKLGFCNSGWYKGDAAVDDSLNKTFFIIGIRDDGVMVCGMSDGTVVFFDVSTPFSISDNVSELL